MSDLTTAPLGQRRDCANALAHKSLEKEHLLHEHLYKVALLSKTNAAMFKADHWAYLAGMWHDLGKYRPGFQRYIRETANQDAHIERKVPGPEKTHSNAGALWAQQVLSERHHQHGTFISRVLQYLIAGHHAGLDNWDDGLAERLSLHESKAAARAGFPSKATVSKVLTCLLQHVMPAPESNANDYGTSRPLAEQ